MSTINKLKRGAGGARPGAGRPVTTHTQQQVDHVNKILRKYARKTGRDLYEIAADMAWALEEFEKTGDPTRRFGIQFLDGASRVAGGDDTEREFPGPAPELLAARIGTASRTEARDITPGPAAMRPVHSERVQRSQRADRGAGPRAFPGPAREAERLLRAV